jgi:hypothetical protein
MDGCFIFDHQSRPVPAKNGRTDCRIGARKGGVIVSVDAGLRLSRIIQAASPDGNSTEKVAMRIAECRWTGVWRGITLQGMSIRRERS